MKTESRPVTVISPIDQSWKDENGHLNYAAYALAADPAIDAVFAAAGLDWTYRERNRRSDYLLQSRFHYLREIRGSDDIEVRSRLVEYDTKRVHIFCEIIDRATGTVAAIAHVIGIHVDTDAGRSVSFADDVLDSLKRLRQAHTGLGKPEFFDNSIGLAKPDLRL